jgi:hypothetical protein
VGWARANLLYDTLRAPPKPGTPLESLMLLVWHMRQTIQLPETRDIVQAITAAQSEDQGLQKAIKESWESFVDELMPYQRGTRKRQDQSAIDFLKKEVARGPLKVIPLVSLRKPRSKLRKRYES